MITKNEIPFLEYNVNIYILHEDQEDICLVQSTIFGLPSLYYRDNIWICMQK